MLNRQKRDGGSIKDIVTKKGQYKGYEKEERDEMWEDDVESAVVAVFRGEVYNPIGDLTNHFGKIDGYDV